MKAFVTDASGTSWELPAAVSWQMEYGIGTPCDSFELRCPWEGGLDTKPRDWVRFYAQQDGTRVFTGVIDECEVSISQQGCFLEMAGRGMAALLLDNEALGQDYQLATLADILRDHVAPYGIETVSVGQIAPIPSFRVETGSSEWTVLEEFVRAGGGNTPRFDSWGRLVLEQWEDKEQLEIGAQTPVIQMRSTEKRYGVLSEILVRDRYSGAVQRIRQEDFCACGGQARRVLTMPGRAGSGAMRQAGQEQLKRSRREWKQIEVTLPLPFCALPGALVRIERSGFDSNGTYRVANSVSGMDENGYWTRLTLRPRENM